MYSKEQIQKIHRTLSPELLEPIASDETLAFVESLATRFDLSVEQMHKTEKVISYRLMGLINKAALKDALQSELGVDSGVAESLENELNHSIFDLIPHEILNKQEIEAEAILDSKNEAPIVITPESKKEVIKELAQRVQAAKQGVVKPAANLVPTNLPMVEKGEVAHDVPPLNPVTEKPVQVEQKEVAKPNIQAISLKSETSPVLEKKPEPNIPPINESKPAQPAPKPLISVDKPANSRYPAGKDPYREPVE